MKALGRMGMPFTFCCTLLAQIQFQTTDLPDRIGEDFWRAYVNVADQDIRPLLGTTGGPQTWDFSYAPTAQERVDRMEVVAPADGGQGGTFALATYAERVTREPDGCRTWSYYRPVPSIGRRYYGMQDACKTPETAIVFSRSTVDLPDVIEFGKTWSREVAWRDVIDAGPFVVEVDVNFNSQSKVDAFGMVMLPELGPVPALRVNEVNSYVVTELTFGIPLDEQVFRNYYWLVPGIGKAVHVISAPATTAPPELFPVAKTVLRVFETSRSVGGPRRGPVENLRVNRGEDGPTLSWDIENGAAGYEIEWTSRLGPEVSWQVLTSTPTPFFSEDLSATVAMKFYRVFWTK